MIINRIKIASMCMTGLAALFGITNFLLIQFRNSPLMATDFSSFGTAMDVAANYTVIFSKPFLWCSSTAVIWMALLLSLETYKSLSRKKHIAGFVALGVGIGGFYSLVAADWAPTKNIHISGFNPKASYKKYGSTLAFILTIKASRIDKPDDYSVEKAESIAKAYKPDKAGKSANDSKKTPNIIVIMNEAYTDLRYVGPFKTSNPYMPYFNSLKENTVKGTMHTSIFGGSTANTEYEFLTGNSLAFMPLHIVPYNNKVNEGDPSLARTLTAQGYKGDIAFHPGMHNSYNRENVYPDLGFDKFISLEELKNPELLRAYVSDRYDFETIVKEYDKYKRKGYNAPFWMFNVTIQNHSDFKLTSGVVDKEVTITDNTVKEEEAEQYLNLVKKTDEALQELIKHYRNSDDPTVIVMFGDHQPRVGDSFYSALLKRSTEDETDLERSEKQYRVPFMIWANFDMKAEDDVQISANYLSSYLLDKLGLRMTGYNKYLMHMYRKLPVVTQICYIDNKGKMFSPKDESKYSKELNEYQILQYNNVVDKKNRIGDFFFLKK